MESSDEQACQQQTCVLEEAGVQLQHVLHLLRQRRCRCLRTRIRRSCCGLLRCRELPLWWRHRRLVQVNDLTSLYEDTKKTDTFNRVPERQTRRTAVNTP